MNRKVSCYDRTLKEVVTFFKNNNIDYCIVGGVAVSVYYQARTTIDIDFIIALSKIKAVILLKLLSKRKFEFNKKRVETDINTRGAFRITKNGIQIDVILKSLSFEEEAFKRKTKIKLMGLELFIPTIEDLVLYKLFANRERDIFDIKNVINSNPKINYNYIVKWTQRVCDEAENMVYWRILKNIFRECNVKL